MESNIYFEATYTKHTMKAKPIFPPSLRIKGHFSKNQKIFLIDVRGHITKEEIESCPELIVNYHKKEGKVGVCSTTSPLIISQEEFLWAKDLLVKYEKMALYPVFGSLRNEACDGDRDAIIFLDWLALINKIHGNNVMYSRNFFQDLIGAMLTTKI